MNSPLISPIRPQTPEELMRTLVVEVRSQYGAEVITPVNESARHLARLLNRKTLTVEACRICVERWGFNLTVSGLSGPTHVALDAIARRGFQS